MNANRWRQLEKLFHAAGALPSVARADYLRDACPHDSRLAAEVLRLVEASERAENFLESVFEQPEQERYGRSHAE
jgi:hypothetical protein